VVGWGVGGTGKVGVCVGMAVCSTGMEELKAQ